MSKFETPANGTLRYHKPLEGWHENDYELIGDPLFPATRKLQSSRVAPVVAVARGYRAFQPNSSEFDEFLKSTYGTLAKRKNAVKSRANNADILYLPNYALDSVFERTSFEQQYRPSGISHQYRPSNPQKNEQGKRIKYAFDTDTQTVLDVHPSTPREYLREPPNILFTEGVLKGDATLTAYLRAHGFTTDELRMATRSANADQILHDMLLQVDPDERLLIVSIAGVYNWKSNPEWSILRLKNSSVWMAFDGDLGVNRDVWEQTTKLMDFLKRSKNVEEDRCLLVDLASVPTSHDEDKVGLDDFFASHGTFDDLPGMLTDAVPDAPQKPIELSIGQYKMNDSATALQKCLPGDEFKGPFWAPVSGVGARILRTSVYRQPTVQEENTWTINQHGEVEADRREVVIEFGYLDGTEGGDLSVNEQTAAHHHARMTAPMSILQMLPAEWGRTDANVPPDILTLAEWPPRREGEQFLREMKASRRDEIEHFERWSRMGWVPSTTPNWPTFIIGDQVISPDNASSQALPGVGEDELPNVSGLGVKLRDKSISDEDYAAYVKDCLEKVLDLFLVNSPWRDSRIGALMLASALRPAMPKRPHLSLYLVGAAKSGKALPVDAYVPVPYTVSQTGLKRVGDIEAGVDSVFGSDGSATRVRAKNDMHEATVYDLHLSDGRVVRSSDRHVWPVRRHTEAQSHNAMATGLFHRARLYDSGEAGRLSDIASEHKLDQQLLATTVETAGIPSMPLLVDDHRCVSGLGWRTADILEILDGQLNAPAALNCATVTKRDLESLQSGIAASLPEPTVWAHGCRQETIYPIGEVLQAYAEALSADGQPVTMSLTTAQLAKRIDEGLSLATIEPPNYAWTANSKWFSRGVELARTIAANECRLIKDELMYGPVHDRVAFLRGFVATSVRLSERTDLKLPSDHDVAIWIKDRSVRADIVTLMRSVGWSPTAASDGTVMFRPMSENPTIIDVVEAGTELCQCLTVDRYDGQFAAADFVLTHNSWTAATAMAFWDKGKNWNEDTLPGSASDTKAATENAVSLAPIWVVDDLAPSSDPRKAEKEQEALETLLRAIHNNTGKRRSSGSGAQQDVKRPQAMLIATAENDIGIHSVISRIITVRMGKNSLESAAMDEMRAMRGSGIAPTVTAALLEFVANKRHMRPEDQDRPLKEVIDETFDMLTGDLHYVVQARHGFADSEFTRQSKLLADLMLILQPLREMAEYYGVDSKYTDLLSVHGEKTMGDQIASLVIDSFISTQTGGPGHSLVKALKQVLRTKGAYIANADDPSMPPMIISDDPDRDGEAKAINSALGWTYTDMGAKPAGREIGVLRRGSDDDQPVIVFYPKAAFGAAKREAPDLIPYGSSEKTSWQAVWEDELAVEGVYGLPRRQRSKAGTPRSAVQVMVHGQRFSGIPVPLSTLDAAD